MANDTLESQLPENKLLGVRNKDFCIISSNCIGSKIYQLMNLPYNTPSVGLFFFAPDFIKFASNLKEYINNKLVPINSSKYVEANESIRLNGMYPIGKLGDVEIHFLHYSDWSEVLKKWNSRSLKINYDRLFFIFTDRDLCNYSILRAFDQLPYSKKVCFTAKKYDLRSCVQIPIFSTRNCVGDLYNNFHILNKYFDFAEWLNE